MRYPFLAICVGLHLLLLSALAQAQSEEEFVALRALPTSDLEQLISDPEPADSASPSLARLVLADRAINSSAFDAESSLSAAEPLLEPGSPAAQWASIIRCQLEHRLNRPASEQSCEALRQGDLAANRFIEGAAHATLAYLYYREGDHDRSMQHANQTLAIAEQMDDPGLRAWAHNAMGIHFSTRLLPRRSVHHLEAAWREAEAIPDSDFKGVIQLNLAGDYTFLGRPGEALEMLEGVKATPLVDLYPARRLLVQSMIAQAQAALGRTEGVEEELIRVWNEVSDQVLADAETFAFTGQGIVRLAAGDAVGARHSFDQIFRLTGQNVDENLSHPRVQPILVPYAQTLRLSGDLNGALALLERVINKVPADQPDQRQLDATRELAIILEQMGDEQAAQDASEEAARLETALWDASFKYQLAQLNASMEMDRQKSELQQSIKREAQLRETAQREQTLRRQSWAIGALLVMLLLGIVFWRTQKRLARTEREANERLEQVVATRTQELKDEMAERTRVEVERRNLIEKLSEGEKLRALGELTAGIAHDFNNLMTVITLTTEHLKASDHPRPSEENDMLGYIATAANTGAGITSRLMAYVRKQPQNPQLIELETFLRDSLPLFRNTLGERVQLNTEFESCQVMVDKGQLTTALINLLANARDALGDAGEVTLSLKSEENNAHISVIDSGVGMSDITLKKAVDPFFTTKKAGEGTGLGLSMVFGFARQSGGDLVIRSEQNSGTQATLILPVCTALAEETPFRPSDVAKIPDQASVLVVEDQELLRRMLSRTLSLMGMKVQLARGADEALLMTEGGQLPDLLISDVVMPGSIDGAELAARLRKRHPSLPVILMSGNAQIEKQDWRFLRKPFSVSQLKQAVAEAVGVTDKAANS